MKHRHRHNGIGVCGGLLFVADPMHTQTHTHRHIHELSAFPVTLLLHSTQYLIMNRKSEYVCANIISWKVKQRGFNYFCIAPRSDNPKENR